MAAVVGNHPQSRPHDSLAEAVYIYHGIIGESRVDHEFGVQEVVKTAEEDGRVRQVPREVKEGPKQRGLEAVVWDSVAKFLNADFGIQILFELVITNASSDPYFEAYIPLHQLTR